MRKIKHLIQIIRKESLRLLNTMVHPGLANDPLEAPRHRAFLAVALMTGAASLILFPLHLALWGPTSVPMVLLIGWMLAQWPLAHYLSQTGRLDLAYGLSSLLFAGFLGAMAYVTGGLASFALIWLAVIPVEAALSGSRKMVAGASLLSIGLLSALFLMTPHDPVAVFSDGVLLAVSAVAAVLYVGGLSVRMIADQGRLRARLEISEGETRLHNQGSGNIVLRCGAEGDIHFVGGNLERLLATTKRQLRGNWLFQRIHVADRPMYLQELAEARSGEGRRRVEFRLRHGANEPGEQGTADYIWVSADIQSMAHSEDGAGEGDILLCLTNITERKEADQDFDMLRTAIEAELQQKNGLVAAAGVQLRGSAENFVKLSGLLNAMPETNQQGGERTRAVVDEMLWTGRKLMQTVEGLQETAALDAGHRSLEITALDLQDALELVHAEVKPIAAGVGVSLNVVMPTTRLSIPADKAAMQHLLIQSFRSVIDGAADGDCIALTVNRVRGNVEIAFTSTAVTVNDNAPAERENDFRFTMVERLCAMQGGVTESHVEKNGDCRLLLKLPCAASVAFAPESVEQGSTATALKIA